MYNLVIRRRGQVERFGRTFSKVLHSETVEDIGMDDIINAIRGIGDIGRMVVHTNGLGRSPDNPGNPVSVVFVGENGWSVCVNIPGWSPLGMLVEDDGGIHHITI